MLQAKPIQEKKRVALYGGAFDPVHNAHIEVARAAKSQLSLDEVVFIPAKQSPLKAHSAYASDSERVEMLELAIAEHPDFRVDRCELDRGGVSYSIHTVENYRVLCPDTELYWMLGADQFEQLDRWYAIEELANLVTFIVFERPEHTVAPPSVIGLEYRLIESPLMNHSSSEIRERLASGAPLEDWVPASVGAFISAHQLYTR